MNRSDDRTAVIVGVGTTAFGALYRDRTARRTAYDLGAEAFRFALADANLAKSDVDGLFTARVPSYARMADVLGMRHLRYCNGFSGAGRMSSVTVQLAAAAIENGLADTVACVYGNNGRSAGATYGGDPTDDPTVLYERSYGMTSPGAYVALMYQNYREFYQAPDDALAPIAISNREFAALNENAVMRKPLTHEEYQASRYITEPLRLFDYCLVNDGGVSIILTTAAKARELGRPAVALRSTATCGDLTNTYASADFFGAACQSVADRVYGEAGIGPEDVDCLQIYDNFTPTVLFSLEGFGFCPPGSSWEWIKEGRLGVDGSLPINTSGGHTSESYMQGWALQVEAVRQLRGEAGPRQVAGCEVVQYICAAPITSSHILTLA